MGEFSSGRYRRAKTVSAICATPTTVRRRTAPNKYETLIDPALILLPVT